MRKVRDMSSALTFVANKWYGKPEFVKLLTTTFSLTTEETEEVWLTVKERNQDKVSHSAV